MLARKPPAGIGEHSRFVGALRRKHDGAWVNIAARSSRWNRIGFGKRSQIVGRLRSFARGGEDRAVVVPEQVEPILDVTGVAQLADDPQMRAEKGGGEFRDQFFGGVGSRPEARRQVAIETRLESRPMTVMPISA